MFQHVERKLIMKLQLDWLETYEKHNLFLSYIYLLERNKIKNRY